jgi:hypothetical protein
MGGGYHARGARSLRLGAAGNRVGSGHEAQASYSLLTTSFEAARSVSKTPFS